MVRKNYYFLFLLIFLLIFSGACNREKTSNFDTPKNQKGPVFEDDPILIESGEYRVTRSEFEIRLLTFPDRDIVLKNKDKIKEIVKFMLEEKILLEKAHELKYQNDPNYLKEVERIEKIAEQEKNMKLIEIMFTKEVDKKFTMDDNAVKNFYNLKKEKFEKRVVSEILRVVKDVNDKAEVKKVQKEIDMIYNKLESGEKFESLAKEYYNGLEIFRVRGGKIGLINRGKFPKDFEDVVYNKLKKNGDISKPFLYNQGWAIVRLDKIYGFNEVKQYVKRDYERFFRTKINKELADVYLKRIHKKKFHELEIEKIIKP